MTSRNRAGERLESCLTPRPRGKEGDTTSCCLRRMEPWQSVLFNTSCAICIMSWIETAAYAQIARELAKSHIKMLTSASCTGANVDSELDHR